MPTILLQTLTQVFIILVFNEGRDEEFLVLLSLKYDFKI